MLPSGATVDAGAGKEDDEAGRGAPLGPVGVGTRAERVGVGRVGRILDAKVLGANEVHENADEAHV
eukprot:5912093-Prymnesium_polylepis.2